jgi:hypothetical protein
MPAIPHITRFGLGFWPLGFVLSALYFVSVEQQSTTSFLTRFFGTKWQRVSTTSLACGLVRQQALKSFSTALFADKPTRYREVVLTPLPLR